MSAVRVAVDAMGGDNAPDAIIEGVILALNTSADIHVLLTGDETLLTEKLGKHTYNKDQLTIVHAPGIIENTDSPVIAVRQKKDASMVVGLRLVKEKAADAFDSDGNTGAVLAGGTLIVGRIKGIQRPALASLIPNDTGFSLLIDCGANVDSKASFLHQFAQMGSIYYESFLNTKNPRIGLVNVGAESSKGNALVKETYVLLKEDSTLNFIGNIEAREISEGVADVVVCDGFVGNVILKYTEGLAMSLLGMIKKAITSTFKAKMGALLIKSSLKKMMKNFDYSEYGGAPLLGLNGLVVKTHGSSDANGVKNTILQCKKFHEQKVNEKIQQNL
ncbi:MAG: phosphate acyltransferase PlsX, partial [Vallitaleaceae bacterium]|nr:phosphate acyltransferase PlsX [Vallitaleaceae bacterium]